MTSIIFIGAWFLAKTLILAALIWIVIKVQKLGCKYPWLLAAAAASAAVDMIPQFGHYLVLPVAILGIWKCIGGAIFPGAVFTGLLAGLAMFCLSFFLLDPLMVKLTTPAEKTENTAGSVPPKSPSNNVGQAQAAKSAEGTNAAVKVKEPVVPQPMPVQPKPMPMPVPAKTAPVKGAQPAAVTKDLSYKSFSLIGFGGTAKRQFAMVRTGTKNYTVGVGDEVSMLSPQGRLKVQCVDMGNKSVTLIIEGRKIVLYL